MTFRCPDCNVRIDGDPTLSARLTAGLLDPHATINGRRNGWTVDRIRQDTCQLGVTWVPNRARMVAYVLNRNKLMRETLLLPAPDTQDQRRIAEAVASQYSCAAMAEQPPLVVVVEDDDMLRAALGRLLRTSGFEPALFDSAEAFLAARLNRAPHCVIVDVHLTGISGLDLQDRLRRQHSEVPVIVTTADGAQTIRERAEQGGCMAFVSKPFSGETILNALGSMARPSLA